MKTFLAAEGCVYSRICVLLGFAALLISGAPQYTQAQSISDEYQVKSAFLFHFAQFVEWPVGTPNAGDTAIRLCIFDDEARRQEFQSTIEGKTIGTRVLHVRLIGQPKEIQGCSMLFISRDEAWRQSAVLRSLRGLPVLTVGETASFLADGGIIRFHFEKDKIRFDIDLQAAESSHLKISSRLLLLATSVTHSGGVADRRR